MNNSEFKNGDYVAVYALDGRVSGYGTVTGESYSGYWVKFEGGASIVIPPERLRLAVKASVNPAVLVSVPKDEAPADKVAAAQEEYDKLRQAQIEIDGRKAELEAEKLASMKRTNQIVAEITERKDQRRANSARMNQLKTFLEFAETI